MYDIGVIILLPDKKISKKHTKIPYTIWIKDKYIFHSQGTTIDTSEFKSEWFLHMDSQLHSPYECYSNGHWFMNIQTFSTINNVVYY